MGILTWDVGNTLYQLSYVVTNFEVRGLTEDVGCLDPLVMCMVKTLHDKVVVDCRQDSPQVVSRAFLLLKPLLWHELSARNIILYLLHCTLSREFLKLFDL